MNASQSPQEHRESLSKVERAIESFAIQKTMIKLFQPRKYELEDKEFEVLNSVKIVSMCSIVLGNTYYFLFQGPVRNLEMEKQLLESGFFTLVFQADL